MLFKKMKNEIRELRYSVQKLIEKYKELENRITELEREKAAAETTARTTHWDKTE